MRVSAPTAPAQTSRRNIAPSIRRPVRNMTTLPYRMDRTQCADAKVVRHKQRAITPFVYTELAGEIDRSKGG
ncbi:hypothetical protein GCM10010973_35650 [Cribrihabitans marinus]|nr:hypothetical protein GCM10010973_35650 [Cribrihabitans marinus]